MEKDLKKRKQGKKLKSNKRKRNCTVFDTELSGINLSALNTTVIIPLSVVKTDDEKQIEMMSTISKISMSVVLLFHNNCPLIDSKTEALNEQRLSLEELTNHVKQNNKGNEVYFLSVLNGFLFICCCLGYIAKVSNSPLIFELRNSQQSISWTQTTQNFARFVCNEIKDLTQTLNDEVEQLEIDLIPFAASEADDVFFSTLSRVLRTGGHKLKSKLKPENIGLLVPGHFLPTHQNILKRHVALRIAEKSNHLYTWKEAGEKGPLRRKKSILNGHGTRNIRPRNRCNFVNEHVFYSAWDSTFYTLKCEEVLENEYYNQLENSLNNHGKRKLSMKKMEINRKKKANDTRDSFYYEAFLHRSLPAIEAANQLQNLRVAVIRQWEKKYKEDDRSNQSPRKSRTHTKREDQKVKVETSPNDVKEESSSDPSYKNEALGSVNKPAAVLSNSSDLLRFVNSRAVNADKIKDQILEVVPDEKIKLSEGSAVKKTKITLPKVRKVNFCLMADNKEYQQWKDITKQGGLHSSNSVKDQVDDVLQGLIFQIVVKDVDGFDHTMEGTSDENTDDEVYEHIHKQYLNLAETTPHIDLGHKRSQSQPRKLSHKKSFKKKSSRR